MADLRTWRTLRTLRTLCTVGLLLLFVQRLCCFVLRLHQRIHGAAHARRVVAVDRLLEFRHRVLDRVLVDNRDLVAGVFQHPLRRIQRLVGAVLDFDFLPPLLVVLGVRLGFPHHAVDFVLAQAG